MFSIQITVKAAGKRRAIMEQLSYTLPVKPLSLKDLICALVTLEVQRYNDASNTENILPFLTDEAYQDGLDVGKVHFNTPISTEKRSFQALAPAIDNALQAFEDGLFKVFINDTEITDSSPFEIQENATVTLIRLTFLAGRFF